MRMISRSGRLRHQSAVMVIDLVNSEQINRDFGRKATEYLPLRVAARRLSTAREIDSAARLSERCFGMLVEGGRSGLKTPPRWGRALWPAA